MKQKLKALCISALLFTLGLFLLSFIRSIIHPPYDLRYYWELRLYVFIGYLVFLSIFTLAPDISKGIANYRQKKYEQKLADGMTGMEDEQRKRRNDKIVQWAVAGLVMAALAAFVLRLVPLGE